ncbi:recombinase family protein [Halococcus qingdaonensis]|uniref:recombinase family protein n=1 Tax=Halococcus qingdaonensis TaxID=224402 RepID=UPI0021170952|nr:recombinase family protein [Halococcus qingdaonensis]
MVRYATYIRASTDTQETVHQRDAINNWLDDHDADPNDVDRYADLGYSGSDPGREQFSELIDTIDAGEYEYVVVWEISRLARLGSIYQRFSSAAKTPEPLWRLLMGGSPKYVPMALGS